MAVNFPTSLDDFTNPASGDPFNSPSHSEQHQNINDAVEALEAKVGVNGSAVTTSHDYKLSDVTTGNKAESSANKETSALDTSTTKYPCNNVVKTAVDGKIANVVEDTTPQLGGQLDAGAHSIGFKQQSFIGDGTTTINWGLGNKAYFTFGNANETFTFTAPSNPCNLVLVLKQYSTGGKTATWPATVMWPGGTAPTLSTGNNAIDIISFYYDGTNYYGVSSLNFSVPA